MICFDTGVVIWGIREDGDDADVNRTKRYIEKLSEQKERILIPAPVLGEYLVGCAPETRAEEYAAIRRSFIVGAFDAYAASIAAELQAKENALKEIRGETGINWQLLKVDVQIVAVAIALGAEKIITHDSHFVKIADSRIAVKGVPDVPKQLSLMTPKTVEPLS